MLFMQLENKVELLCSENEFEFFSKFQKFNKPSWILKLNGPTFSSLNKPCITTTVPNITMVRNLSFHSVY